MSCVASSTSKCTWRISTSGDSVIETLSYISKGVNTFSLLLLVYGLSQRRRPQIHMKVMCTCFAIDLANVLLIELVLAPSKRGKSAIGTALESDLFSLLNFHVLVSVLCLVGYGVAVPCSGWPIVAAAIALHRSGVCRIICSELTRE